MICKIERLDLEMLRAFLRKQADDAFPDLKDEGRLDMLAEKWAANAECCTCRDDDNELIGMIAFYANNPQSGFSYIPHVYVSSSHRKMGVFSRMLGKVDEYVRKKGITELRLEVGNNNRGAYLAYLRNGFVLKEIASPRSIYMTKMLKK